MTQVTHHIFAFSSPLVKNDNDHHAPMPMPGLELLRESRFVLIHNDNDDDLCG